jgi:hypothetical protein
MTDADAIFDLLKANKRRFELESGAYYELVIGELRRDIEQLKAREKVPEKILEMRTTSLMQAIDYYNAMQTIVADYEQTIKLLKFQVIITENAFNRVFK